MSYRWMCKLCEAESCMHDSFQNAYLNTEDEHFLCETCYKEVLEATKTKKGKLQFKEEYVKGTFCGDFSDDVRAINSKSFVLDLSCDDCNMSYGGTYNMYRIGNQVICEDCLEGYETPAEQDFWFKEGV